MSRVYKPCGYAHAWFASDKKQTSRHFILDCWQAFSGQSNVPRQYWTLCGLMADAGILQEGSELKQLESEGLFTASQFIGVEKLPNVYQANDQAASRLKPSERPTLHYGDIIDVLHTYLYEGRLAASIVNLDTTGEAQSAIPLLRRTLNVLNHIDGPTMVIWNVITGRYWPRNRWTPTDARDDAIETSGKLDGYVSNYLLEDARFREAYRHGWDMFPDGEPTSTACRYDGATARSKTQMTMYVFVRRREACGDNCTC